MASYTKMLLGLGACTVATYYFMMAIIPDPEELKKKLPEHNPQHMRSSQRQQASLRQALQKAADNPDPIWKSK